MYIYNCMNILEKRRNEEYKKIVLQLSKSLSPYSFIFFSLYKKM